MITIDPGLRGVGLAEWFDGKLMVARYVKNPEPGRGYRAHNALGNAARTSLTWHSVLPPSTFVIIEHPVVYPGLPQKDLNDLLDVVAVGAACAARIGGRVETVFPSAWKGNVKKDVMLERIRSKLTSEELENVEHANKSDMQDVLDAIGIGLWKLGRLNTKVYPGATK